MVRTALVALLVLCHTALASPTKRLLVVTHTTGFRHESIPAAEEVLGELGASTGLYETDYCRTAGDVRAMLTPAYLAGVDAVFFANTTGDLGIPDLPAFLAWVRSGGAFLGAHSASDTYRATCETGSGYKDMLGAEVATHGALASAELRVEERTHPSVAHLPPRWTVFDEIYEFGASPRPTVHVLLSMDRHPDDGHPAAGEPGDFPLAWWSRHGDGVVWYTALGHREEVWRDPDFRRHLLGALRWAFDLTDHAALTIPAAASAPGRFGTLFRTDLWLLNRSHGAPVTVSLRLRCAAGAACPSEARSLTLAPRAVTLLSDVVGQLLSAPGAFGAIEISWPKREGPVSAFSRVFTAAPGGGTLGAAVPPLPAAAARTRSVFVGLAAQGGGSRTNAGVSNPAAESAEVTFQLFDGAGARLGVARTVALPPRATLQLDDVFAALQADAGRAATASLVVSCEVPVLPYVTVVDNASGDSVLLPAFEDAAEDAVTP